MIVRFAITPKSLYLLEVEPGRRSQVLRQLVHTWGRAGRLVIPGGETGRARFLQEITNLPQELRKMWQTAIKQFSFRIIPTASPRLPIDNQECLQDLVGVLEVFGHETAEVSMPEEMRIASCPELTLSSQIPNSCAFLDAIDLAESYIPEGVSLESIWRERFEPIASSAHSITLIDRYSTKELQDRSCALRDSALYRFISTLSKCRQISLSVYSSYDDKTEGAIGIQLAWQALCDSMNTINTQLNSDDHLQIKLHVLPNSQFKKYHDRMILFDYQVLEIGTGLELFKKDKTWRGTTFTLKQVSGAHKEILSRLSQLTRSDRTWSSG